MDYWIPWGAGAFHGACFGVSVMVSDHPLATAVGWVVGSATVFFVWGKILRNRERRLE